MEVDPALVFLSFQRNEIAGLPLEGLKKMIRLRVFDIAAKIPKKKTHSSEPIENFGLTFNVSRGKWLSK